MNTIKTLNHITVSWLTKCRRCCISKYSLVEARRTRKVSSSYRCGCSHTGLKLSKLCNRKIQAVIDRVIPFEEVVDGLKALESGQVLGKIIVQMKLKKEA